jgi:hypothetical protein
MASKDWQIRCLTEKRASIGLISLVWSFVLTGRIKGDWQDLDYVIK